MAKHTISIEAYEEMQDENNGLCLKCGEIQYGDCEPDARKYKCESCGAKEVYGLDECLIMGLVD